MAIKIKVKSLEEVDEEDRGSYRELPDKSGFVFAPAEYQEIAETLFVPGLKSALTKEKETRIKRTNELLAYQELGDPEELAARLAEVSKGKKEKAEKEQDWEGMKAQMAEEFEKERKKLLDKTRGLEADLEVALIDGAVDSAIAEEGGNATLLRGVVRQNVRLKRGDDGRLAPVIVQEDGKTPRVGDSSGNPMTPRQYVASLKEVDDFKPAFVVPVKQGIPGEAGTTGAPDRSKFGQVRSRKDLKTDAEKSAFIDAKGFEAFTQLPRE